MLKAFIHQSAHPVEFREEVEERSSSQSLHALRHKFTCIYAMHARTLIKSTT